MRRHAAALGAAFALTVGCSAGCSSSGGGNPAATPPATNTAPTNTAPTNTAPTVTAPTATGPASPTTPSGSSPTSTGAGDWPTYHGTPDRAGVSTTMPAVSGPLRLVQSLKLDEAMYASPVVAGGTVIAATEGNTVYALSLDGRIRWQRNLGAPSPAGERPCGNVDPLGITGTPVVAGDTVYVAPELGNPVRHQLVALDLGTGAVRWRRSIDLPGVETVAMQERGALAVAGGRVWVPMGGLYGDCGGYKGRVIGVQLDGTGDPVSYTVPTTREAGIWAPPGPAVDADNNLFVAVGNGEAGTGDPYDHSDSVLKLGTDAALLDSFSPKTWAHDNENDLDLGSQGPALVGTRWVFAAGKSGTAYVLRRDHLGGIGGEVSSASLCASFGGTAVVDNVVYVPCDDGVRAVRIDDAGTMHQLWHAGPTGSPVVGGGRVWSVSPDSGDLLALDPATGATLERVHVGTTSRFATPALYGRFVLVPTLSGLAVVRTS